MRIVLTGTTGFVGGEVLEQLRAHREVDSVTSRGIGDAPSANWRPGSNAFLHTISTG